MWISRAIDSGAQRTQPNLQVLRALAHASTSDAVVSTDLAHAIAVHTFQEVSGCRSYQERTAVGRHYMQREVASGQTHVIGYLKVQIVLMISSRGDKPSIFKILAPAIAIKTSREVFNFYVIDVLLEVAFVLLLGLSSTSVTENLAVHPAVLLLLCCLVKRSARACHSSTLSKL